MRVLLVEDKADFAEAVERAIRPIPNCELVWVASRDAALKRLAAEFFDLVLLDRQIPSADEVLDDHPDHGWRVFQFMREELPGTPVWFLTATEDADFAADINNSHGRIQDIHGRQLQEQMYQVCWKRRMPDCLRKVREFAEQRGVLDGVAIRTIPADLQLSDLERRTLRLFARRRHGASVDLTSLSGGLSSSRVLRATVRAANDAALLTAVAKVAPLPQIRDEAQRYQEHVTRLAPGGFPQLTEQIEVGAGNFGGLFYGMIGDNVESLFHRIADGRAGIEAIPGDLRRIEQTWYHAKQVRPIQIAQIRRHLIGDASLRQVRPQLDGIEIAGIEARTVNVALCVQHGDMHCANVVFDQRGQAMIIDFGDVGPAFSALDPVTLELSTVFHTQHSMLPDNWPTEAGIGQWLTLEHYTNGCAFAPFVSACRQWALAEAGSQDEIVAMAYAYAMRQLKYPDTNKRYARALIRACIAHFAT